MKLHHHDCSLPYTHLYLSLKYRPNLSCLLIFYCVIFLFLICFPCSLHAQLDHKSSEVSIRRGNKQPNRSHNNLDRTQIDTNNSNNSVAAAAPSNVLIKHIRRDNEDEKQNINHPSNIRGGPIPSPDVILKKVKRKKDYFDWIPQIPAQTARKPWASSLNADIDFEKNSNQYNKSKKDTGNNNSLKNNSISPPEGDMTLDLNKVDDTADLQSPHAKSKHSTVHYQQNKQIQDQNQGKKKSLAPDLITEEEQDEDGEEEEQQQQQQLQAHNKLLSPTGPNVLTSVKVNRKRYEESRNIRPKTRSNSRPEFAEDASDLSQLIKEKKTFINEQVEEQSHPIQSNIKSTKVSNKSHSVINSEQEINQEVSSTDNQSNNKNIKEMPSVNQMQFQREELDSKPKSPSHSHSHARARSQPIENSKDKEFDDESIESLPLSPASLAKSSPSNELPTKIIQSNDTEADDTDWPQSLAGFNKEQEIKERSNIEDITNTTNNLDFPLPSYLKDKSPINSLEENENEVEEEILEGEEGAEVHVEKIIPPQDQKGRNSPSPRKSDKYSRTQSISLMVNDSKSSIAYLDSRSSSVEVAENDLSPLIGVPPVEAKGTKRPVLEKIKNEIKKATNFTSNADATDKSNLTDTTIILSTQQDDVEEEEGAAEGDDDIAPDEVSSDSSTSTGASTSSNIVSYLSSFLSNGNIEQVVPKNESLDSKDQIIGNAALSSRKKRKKSLTEPIDPILSTDTADPDLKIKRKRNNTDEPSTFDMDSLSNSTGETNSDSHPNPSNQDREEPMFVTSDDSVETENVVLTESDVVSTDKVNPVLAVSLGDDVTEVEQVSMETSDSSPKKSSLSVPSPSPAEEMAMEVNEGTEKINVEEIELENPNQPIKIEQQQQENQGMAKNQLEQLQNPLVNDQIQVADPLSNPTIPTPTPNTNPPNPLTPISSSDSNVAPLPSSNSHSKVETTRLGGKKKNKRFSSPLTSVASSNSYSSSGGSISLAAAASWKRVSDTTNRRLSSGVFVLLAMVGFCIFVIYKAKQLLDSSEDEEFVAMEVTSSDNGLLSKDGGRDKKKSIIVPRIMTDGDAEEEEYEKKKARMAAASSVTVNGGNEISSIPATRGMSLLNKIPTRNNQTTNGQYSHSTNGMNSSTRPLPPSVTGVGLTMNALGLGGRSREKDSDDEEEERNLSSGSGGGNTGNSNVMINHDDNDDIDLMKDDKNDHVKRKSAKSDGWDFSSDSEGWDD